MARRKHSAEPVRPNCRAKWPRNSTPIVTKAFTGQWLFTDLAPEQDESGITWDPRLRYGVALTQEGNIAVFEEQEWNQTKRLEVYESFDALKNAEADQYPAYPWNVIAATAEGLSQPYIVELDC